MGNIDLKVLYDTLKCKPCNDNKVFSYIVNFKNECYNALHSGHPEEVAVLIDELVSKIYQDLGE